MEDFLVVHVFKGETNLGKPVQNFVFIEILRFPRRSSQLILVLDFGLQVAPITVVHNYTQFAFFCFVYFTEARNIGVVQNFENLCFSQCLFALLLTHLTNVDLFNDSQNFVRLAFNQICSSETSNPQGADLLICFVGLRRRRLFAVDHTFLQ